MKTKQEIEKIADAYIDNMDSRSFWDSFISGYETCQKDYEAKEIEKLWRKNYIFVYKKDGVIRCLDLADSMKEEQKLIKDGWVHTSTIDPIVFIENLHNVRKIDTEL